MSRYTYISRLVSYRLVFIPEIWSILIISMPVSCIFHYFVQWPTNAQLFHKLSHCYMFRHYRVILRELVINTLPGYTSISNAAVGNTIYILRCFTEVLCKFYYKQMHLKYLRNLARYWLQAAWGWHDSVETCRSVIICEIIVHLLVIVQNKKEKKKKNKIKKYSFFQCFTVHFSIR